MSRRKNVKKCMWWLLIFIMISEAIPIPADAGLLVQSEGRVTQELYHEHGGSDSACYGRVFNECGGYFYRISEDSQYYCCSKCRIYILGQPPHSIHEGEYRDGLVCEEGLIGSFYIERVENAEGIFLVAGIEGRSELISEYEISWSEDGAYDEGDTSVMPVTMPASYHAVLRYYDQKGEVWKEASLEYTDLTLPCRVRYYSEGSLLAEVERPYGSSFAAIEQPERIGYDFEGFYSGTNPYFDGNGQPVGLGTQPLETALLELTAVWSAKRFPFRYGPDGDGDGLGDEEAMLIYDQAPPAITIPVPDERPGFELEGYYIGDRKLYDAQGSAIGVWTELPEELPLRLEERWKERFYTLHYDRNRDGVKEAEATLRYGEALPQLEKPQEIPGEVFEGYFYDGRQIYDDSGRPVAALPQLFEQGSISLEDVWHTKQYVVRYGPDEDRDGVPDGRMEIAYGETPPAVELQPPAPRKGYEFDGYAVNGEKIYDRDGNPVGEWRADLEEGSYELEILWKPKEYRLYYGPDQNGDGVPDQFMTLRYGSLPPAITLPKPAVQPGYVFDGYYVGEQRLFDPDGRAVAPWTSDPEGGGKLILTERFHPVSITIFYGPDLNGDGRPDHYRTLRYGDPMPVLDLGDMKERKGYRFLGYFAGERMIYDAKGTPVTEYCTFTTQEGSYILNGRWEAKSYILRYGTDEDGDGSPDNLLQVIYGQPYPAVGVPKLEAGRVFDGYYLDGEMVYDPEGRPKELWIWDSETDLLEMKSHVLPAEKAEEEKGKGGRGSGANDTGKQNDDEGNNGGNDPGTGDDRGNDDAGGEGDGDGEDEKDPGAAVSDNTVSGNMPGDEKKKASGGSKKEIHAPATDKREQENENAPGIGDEERIDVPLIGADEASEEEDRSDVFSEDTKAKNDSEGEPEAEEALPELSGSEDKPNEKRDTGALPIIKKAAAVGAVTVGGLGGILGIYAGLIYLMAMAEVETICPDGRKKRLGRLTIHSEKGKAFLISLPREMLEQCETDRICLHIPLLFVMLYHKRSIVIQTRIKMQEKQISREIFVKI